MINKYYPYFLWYLFKNYYYFAEEFFSYAHEGYLLWFLLCLCLVLVSVILASFRIIGKYSFIINFLEEFVYNVNSSFSIWENSPVKPSVPRVFFVGRFVTTNLIFLWKSAVVSLSVSHWSFVSFSFHAVWSSLIMCIHVWDYYICFMNWPIYQ